MYIFRKMRLNQHSFSKFFLVVYIFVYIQLFVISLLIPNFASLNITFILPALNILTNYKGKARHVRSNSAHHTKGR